MSNFIFSPSDVQPSWTPVEVVEQQPERERGMTRWWYRHTAPPRPPNTASYVRRELDRKARLLSAVAFFFLLTLLLFLPACFFMPPITPPADIFAIVAAIIALVVNRTGHTMAAGIIMVLGAEIALSSVVLGIRPFQPVDVQLYDLYV